MKKNKIKNLSKLAIVATLYIVATMAVAPLSFGPFQLRFSEILTLLCFYNPQFSISLILGCFITNLYSPLTYYDLIFGVASTIFTVAGISLFGKYKPFGKTSLWFSTLFASISMVFVAYELFLLGEPFWFSFLTTFIGEFLVVSVLGYFVFVGLEKSDAVMFYIKNRN